jgi:hypothetical protein
MLLDVMFQQQQQQQQQQLATSGAVGDAMVGVGLLSVL